MRRFHAAEEKRRIVEETPQPRASVARVARAHGMNANQVFSWRCCISKDGWNAGPAKRPICCRFA
jgi:transposase-like protein